MNTEKLSNHNYKYKKTYNFGNVENCELSMNVILVTMISNGSFGLYHSCRILQVSTLPPVALCGHGTRESSENH